MMPQLTLKWSRDKTHTQGMRDGGQGGGLGWGEEAKYKQLVWVQEIRELYNYYNLL